MKLVRWFGIVAFSLPLFSATFHVSNVQEFRQALEDAALNGENDTIVLAPGVYKTVEDGVGTFTFNDQEGYNLTIQGSGANMNDTILDGNNSTQVLNVQNSKPFALIIEKLSILNGKVDKRGGGVYTNSNTIIRDCNISYNRSTTGGGIYSRGDVTIKDSIISYNISYDDSPYAYGGGFYSGRNASISNSKIFNNICKAHWGDGLGGGFYSNGKLIITASTIWKNSAKNGGGFYSNNNLVIEGSVISHNSASFYGGGFYNVGLHTKKIIKNSEISYNSAISGGGFYSQGDSIIENSNIFHNTASNYYNAFGGGFNSEGGDILIKKSKFIDNTVSTNFMSSSGGGFYHKGYVVIIDSLFANNTSKSKENNSRNDAGAFKAATVIAINNNFIKNSPKIVGRKNYFINNVFVNDGIVVNGNSYLYNNYINYKNIVKDNDYLLIKKSNLQPSVVGDIKLADDNLTLLPGSPAIDAGLNPDDERFKKLFKEETYQEILQYLKTDYFGYPRIVNGRIDIGATEYGAASTDSKPVIHIQISGDQKVYSPVIIHLSIESSKSIAALYIDKGEGYEPVDVNQRTFTLTFQKPGEHTIKFKVVDEDGNEAEVNKTLHIYAMSVQEAIEYGKKLCKQDPVSCGIQVETQTSKDMIFVTPKEHLVQILAQQSVFPISGYFIHYNDPQSPNPKFDWIYLTLHKSVYKLQGMKSDGSFSWSENLKNGFSSIEISHDGKSVTFLK